MELTDWTCIACKEVFKRAELDYRRCGLCAQWFCPACFDSQKHLCNITDYFADATNRRTFDRYVLEQGMCDRMED